MPRPRAHGRADRPVAAYSPTRAPHLRPAPRRLLFNSFTFLGFFAVVLAAHSLPLPWRWRKSNLLVASYIFYAAWNPPFIVLLWFSTIVDWIAAKGVYRASTPARRRAYLWLSLVGNLGPLIFYKYSEMLVGTFAQALASAGIAYQPAAPDVVLPVGISFYTFQTLSYTLDVYRKRERPSGSFLDYALYVTFFPQLVAGPIVRWSQFAFQLATPRRGTGPEIAWGLALIVLGLFQKSVIADGWLGPVVQEVFDSTATPSGREAWIATFAFTGQLFCDLAGYSTCAIGAALCLGFYLPVNFRFPFAAIGFADFWQRWHLSLSYWLRDYLYIPLGGSRRGARLALRNVFITMVLGGLWHGAAWTFVLWGVVQGALLGAERLIRTVFRGDERLAPAVVRVTLCVATYLTMCFTFTLFRAQSFDRALVLMGSMIEPLSRGSGQLLRDGQVLIALVVVGAILTTHWLMRDTTLEAMAARTPTWLRASALAAMLIAIATVPRNDHAFIYFQF